MRLEDILDRYGEPYYPTIESGDVLFPISELEQIKELSFENEEEEEEEQFTETKWIREDDGWISSTGSYLTNEDFYSYIIGNVPYNSELIVRDKIGH